MTVKKSCLLIGTIALMSLAGAGTGAAVEVRTQVKTAVDQMIGPVMKQQGIPGMAVGIVDGRERYIFDYGVASKETGAPVTDRTLFEVGSISKTFTATLAAYAEVTGGLTLDDTVGKYLPMLKDTKIGGVTLVNLGTHTPGGFPLQVPAGITTRDQLMSYFKAWQPTYAPGTYRTYANPSVALLGFVTAAAMKADFTALMTGKVISAFGLTSTYLDVPEARMSDYAWGYGNSGKPLRFAPTTISPEAYGIRTTASDLLRVLEINMGMVKVDPMFQRAVVATHTGYFHAGPMIQDLIWEQYPYPVDLQNLLEGNSTRMIMTATPVTKIAPPMAPRQDVLINKTGSTDGFGAYVAFVPAEQLGVVVLANRSYPIEARVRVAYQILRWVEADRKQ